MNYFKSISNSTYAFQCPLYANPADFFMKILSITYPIKEADIKKVQFLKENYDQQLLPQILSEQNTVKIPGSGIYTSNKGTAKYSTQIKQLLRRNWIQAMRDPMLIKVKLGQTIFIGLLVLAIFWGLDGNSHVEKMGLVGALFFVCLN